MHWEREIPLVYHRLATDLARCCPLRTSLVYDAVASALGLMARARLLRISTSIRSTLNSYDVEDIKRRQIRWMATPATRGYKGVRRMSSEVNDDKQPINSHGGTKSYASDPGKRSKR